MAFISQAFIDESGGESTSTFVLGGYLGDSAMWEGFSDAWQHVLQDFNIDVFHMVKCEGGKEDGFECLDHKDRLDMCHALVDVIATFRPLAFSCEVSVDAWKDVVAPRFAPLTRKDRTIPLKTVARLYGYCASAIALHIARLVEYRGVRFDKVDLCFDWQEQYHKTVKRLVDDDIVPWLIDNDPIVGARMGSTHWPRLDERMDYIPLQAADLLVWHRRRFHDHPDGRHRPIWFALDRSARPAKLQITRQHLEKDVSAPDGVLSFLIRSWDILNDEP
jgi:hypothetical protein